MFALVDGNNFYASCEQLGQWELRGKPLVVLSNNDGCAIARSAEAKALGVKMGHPAHELGDLVRRHGWGRLRKRKIKHAKPVAAVVAA